MAYTVKSRDDSRRFMPGAFMCSVCLTPCGSPEESAYFHFESADGTCSRRRAQPRVSQVSRQRPWAALCYLTSYTSFKMNLEKLYQIFNHLA